MRKRFTIFLISFLGVSTVLVYLFIGYFLFQKGLLFPEAGASPATCTVDDALRVNGLGIGINTDSVENAPEDKILNIQTGTDWPRIILESTHSPSSKAELNLWARDAAGVKREMNIFHTAGSEMGIWSSYSGDFNLVIKPNGNVGIGTTDPGGNKLKVAGDTEITGNLNVDGTISMGGKTVLTSAALDCTIVRNNCGAGACEAKCPAGYKATGGACYLLERGSVAAGTDTTLTSIAWDTKYYCAQTIITPDTRVRAEVYCCKISL